MTTDRIPADRQDNAKTARRVGNAMGTVAYWRQRLYRNTYRDRSGRKVTVPTWYVRLRHGDVTRQVRLNFGDKDQAAEEALSLFLTLQREGWAVVDARRLRTRNPAGQTIDDFCQLYGEVAQSMDRPPRPVSVNGYCKALRQLCALAKIKSVAQLNREAIERARDQYRAIGRKAGRDERGILNTWGKIVRNASACFSVEARQLFARRGFNVGNPFEGVPRRSEIAPVVPLQPAVLDRIWNELPLLRDGDPRAAAPRKPEGKTRLPRHLVDFRAPHPEAYAAVLLAIGAGLRANEIDKARWSWFTPAIDGGYYLDVRPESDFTPKGGTGRRIRIPGELFDAIAKALPDHTGDGYVIGGAATRPAKKTNSDTVTPPTPSYRRPTVFRTANAWLRARGVEADESRGGNPLHRLRKQFGSELATNHGLFAAQKLLGHSSPTVTAKYYAAQTELPELTHIRIMGGGRHG